MFDFKYKHSPDIYIWNPLVRKFKIVPEPPLSTFERNDWSALAFGFLPELNDYVVVHIVKPGSTSAPFSRDEDDHTYEQYPHSVVIGVYSLNTNSWKKICQDKFFVEFVITGRSLFVNGTAYWVGFYSRMLSQSIVYFDTKTNILGQVKVPDWIALHTRLDDIPVILPFGQSIAYFVEVGQGDADEGGDEYGSRHLEMWVFKDYMVDEFSWEKKLSVCLSENIPAQVLGIRNSGEPLLAKSNNLISYDLDTHEPYDFIESTPYTYHKEHLISPYTISPFVETLLLLDID
ncbi:F-box protein At4g22390-like [Apium graveolens]|uniref:F-box protein At4g22390-like n=1 Tax=Apium graveolens TaxID=4045 RepID=UPI003D7B6049